MLGACPVRPEATVIRRLLTVVAVSLLVCAAGVGLFLVLRMDYVPSAEKILAFEHLRPFLVEASDIRGIYGNLDVDSAVFRYTTGVVEEEFWRRIEQQVAGTAWTAIPPDGEIRRFQRVFPPKGQGRFWWVDELRVRYQRSTRKVVVAWVQADPTHGVSGLAECSEADFADRVIWPKLREE